MNRYTIETSSTLKPGQTFTGSIPLGPATDELQNFTWLERTYGPAKPSGVSLMNMANGSCLGNWIPGKSGFAWIGGDKILMVPHAARGDHWEIPVGASVSFQQQASRPAIASIGIDADHELAVGQLSSFMPGPADKPARVLPSNWASTSIPANGMLVLIWGPSNRFTAALAYLTADSFDVKPLPPGHAFAKMAAAVVPGWSGAGVYGVRQEGAGSPELVLLGQLSGVSDDGTGSGYMLSGTKAAAAVVKAGAKVEAVPMSSGGAIKFDGTVVSAGKIVVATK